MKDYFMGLDMGTGSLGWAVTDSGYCLCRAHGKDLWGIRLFESANTAEERRVFRCGRRRLDRRNRRIQLLQQIFAEEMAKVDPGFFLRLKESRYVPEDKRDLNGQTPELPYALFVDQSYTDKDFHRDYPTIYHLRKELMESCEAKDIRLVYLALHHIIKHRGHFLFSGIEADKITDFYGTFTKFIQVLKEQELEFNLEPDKDQCVQAKEILENPQLTKTAKASRLIQKLQAKTDCEKAVMRLLAGCKVKLSGIFGDKAYDETEKPQISFSEAGYDEYEEILEGVLDDQFIVIAAAKAIYDWSMLVHILGDARTISEAKVKVYEKHRRDLKILKDMVRDYLSREDYKAIFAVTDEKKNNYCAYIGMTKNNNKKVPLSGKECSREEFYAFLKKEVVDRIEDKGVTEMLIQEIELGTFLPKQVCKENGVIPYQLQEVELLKIVRNAGEYLPFLKENGDKIQNILTFRIPYYVGPLNVVKEADHSFAWAKRKSGEPVYPWNFEDVIDVEASAEIFIRRMTNKCTYLPCEDVLPRESLLYSKFMVLNELNNLRVNGDKISVELKQDLYENLFKRYRKVTVKKLRNYLIQEGIVEKGVDLSGIDGDFKASLKSYHDLKEKLTGLPLSETEQEQLILNVTLFGDDKALLKRRIKKMFSSLTEGQVKGICALSYKGWGRLSRKFLEEVISPIPETGEIKNIIGALWETNDNLMQLLSNRYGFLDAIDELNSDGQKSELMYKTVEQLYVSPAVKRQIWQTLKVVKEIKKEMGGDPRRVFLEVAREKQDSGRTMSRKKTLQELYRKCQEEEHDWLGEIGNRDEHTFKSDRLYLYYTQKGRCMYCGKRIDIQNLWDKNTYDIDHIFPQSKVMDDSLRNRVLTCRTCNANKTDHYPLHDDIRQKMKPFWSNLKNIGLIDEEKYKRLIRADEFSPFELAGFIERQLVETRQSTKAVADILKKAMPDTEIVYVKAKTVSAFRQQFELIKVRELNDYHHGKDAYLNIVVGNTYFVKFTKNASWFIEQNPGRSYNLKRMFEFDVESKGETAWKAGSKGTINTVRKMMGKNSLLFTRRSFEVQGGLFAQQPLKKGRGQVPIKSSDERLLSIEKYGGYNDATGAYFVLVESEGKKGMMKRTIECVPLYRKKELNKSEEKLLEYLKEEMQLKNPRILLRKIKKDTLFNVDGFRMHLSARADGRLSFKGANQLLVNSEQEKVLKKVVRITEQIKQNKSYKINTYDGVAAEDLNDLYQLFMRKIENPPYNVRLSSQIPVLAKGKEKFEHAAQESKCQILYEILHLFQCNSSLANLTGIGGAKNAGTLKLSKDITKCGQISIIYQSPAGIREREIDLKRL